MKVADARFGLNDRRANTVTPWAIVFGAFTIGASLLLLSKWRARDTSRIREAVRDCPIGEIEVGRFRIVGRVVPILTSRSLVDGSDCVYAERAEYRSVGSGLVPLLREVEHGATCHPFYLEDPTGRVHVDPASTMIECATATADGGLTAERRLRAGEEVSLVATFAPADDGVQEIGGGPYRARARRWVAVADGAGPPRLSHRTEESMVRAPPDGLTAFLGGVGAMMVLMGCLLAFVVGCVL